MAADLEDVGVPSSKRDPACAEGGDLFWLDASTLAVGLGYRTNDDGVATLRRLLPGVEILTFDLPHLRGPAECLHLLSLLSPLDRDLVVASPLMPVRLMRELSARGIALVEVPEGEFDTMGANVLALAPRVALALEATRRPPPDGGRRGRGRHLPRRRDQPQG